MQGLTIMLNCNKYHINIVEHQKMNFKEYLSEAAVTKLKTREEIEAWLEKVRVKMYSIDDDLEITTRDNVVLENIDISFLPVTFKLVNGDFIIKECNLKSLKGVPRVVKGNFDCTKNYLQSLAGGPVQVYGAYDCSRNRLTSIRSPLKSLAGLFDCSNNPITSLKGALTDYSDFNCTSTKITNFVGGPVRIENSFQGDSIKTLTSVEGLPATVGKDIHVRFCNNVTSLHNIGKSLKSCRKYTMQSTVTQDVLGLLLFTGDIDTEYVSSDSELFQVMKIVQKYRDAGKAGVFDCQEALIDAGYEDYANV